MYNEVSLSNEKSISWKLIDLELILKDKNITKESLVDVVRTLSNIPVDHLRTSLDWFFFIKNVRRCIKKVDQNGLEECEKLDKLISKIADKSKIYECCNNAEQILKLMISCKERGFEVAEKFVSLLEDLYEKYQFQIDIELDEFIFIDCEMREKSKNQRILRYLVLFDPMEGMKRTCEGVDDKFWFILMSFNDSELIKFMKSLLDQNKSRFMKFYSFIIKEELISVDFLVDQLLTDSPALLELLLAVFGASPDVLIGQRHFKNFHVLLSLKLELFASNFPFNCEILCKKLEKFNNRIKKIKEE